MFTPWTFSAAFLDNLVEGDSDPETTERQSQFTSEFLGENAYKLIQLHTKR